MTRRVPSYDIALQGVNLGLEDLSVNYEQVLNPIPEPSTWVMIIVGFAAVGFVGYRRTRVAIPAA